MNRCPTLMPIAQTARSTSAPRASLRAAALVSSLALVLVVGCATPKYLNVRSAPNNPLVDQLKLRTKTEATERSMQVLRQYNLTEELRGNPAKLLTDLQSVIEHDPTAEKLYTFAELSYRAGQKVEARDRKAALDYYGASVAYSYLYLFDTRFASLRNPYDPQFRGACELYNGALEATLRLAKKQGSLMPGRTHHIETAWQKFDVTVALSSQTWKSEDIEEIKFASDFEVTGLTNQFRAYGLGVPLIAVRKRPETKGDQEKYYPEGMTFPLTAFMRLLPDENCNELRPGARHRALLELYDPMEAAKVAVGQNQVPLESDLSTPLAYFLNQNKKLNDLATYGLLRPDKEGNLTGLYMLQPYQPGKIPVVMVHGLWSSPLTWTEMFNDLRSVPELRDNYQIWFYLYPTGEPFWNSATRCRRDLAAVRKQFDPERREPAFDQMVMVGHSMGGLVSKLQTINSQDSFWKIESDQPFDVVKASFEEKEQLAEMFFFQANPSVRRLITIATPHRGSSFANDTTRYLAQKFISLPRSLVPEKVVTQNPGVFRDTTLVSVKTSLDSLDPRSPVLPVMLQSDQPPWVKSHNIVGMVPERGLAGKFAGEGDGVVAFKSAHLERVNSEIVVPSDHMNVHRHPLAVLEVRRILLEHLRELKTGSPFTPRSLQPQVIHPALFTPPVAAPSGTATAVPASANMPVAPTSPAAPASQSAPIQAAPAVSVQSAPPASAT
ncbi:MAG: alpha/beta fold hydrolase [Planctomycetes bacterium]|nr:alpha/beta fold hydrolase [Planctomycetota bacterium]